MRQHLSGKQCTYAVLVLWLIFIVLPGKVVAENVLTDPLCVPMPFPEMPSGPTWTSTVYPSEFSSVGARRLTFWRVPCDTSNSNILVRLEPLTDKATQVTVLVVIQDGKQYFASLESEGGALDFNCTLARYLPITCRLRGSRLDSGWDDDRAFTIFEMGYPETKINIPAYDGTTGVPTFLRGTIKSTNDQDICAMVLASGKFMFSCNPPGEFSLSDLPRENDGTVKRQIYADGFFPKVNILADSTDDAVVMTRSGTCPRYNASYDPAFVPNSAGKRIIITGKVLTQNSQTPICAMVLANGKHTFSCNGTGSYALNIPLDNNGQFKLQVYADGFAPMTQIYDEFKTTNNVRMARASECQ